MAKADSDKRESMLSEYTKKQETSPASPTLDQIDVVLAKARAGQLRKTRSGRTTKPLPHAPHPICNEVVATSSPSEPMGLPIVFTLGFRFSLRDETCQSVLTTCVYRDFFLRDYGTGEGRHYSVVRVGSQEENVAYASLDKPDLTLP
ncbi:fungal-specific transcription factor domain-containing protein [Apiospora phragmitis]|uniref:Fungal-specific transcription factor domain-containing protein n=1 Tax=Apiospora phragmitis TaxID=2905665 RepID=A0ABR1WUV9_9PEZI